MLGTGVRCGELIGLTWEDVDGRTKVVSIDHQLIYKDLGDGYKFHIFTPKTDSGILYNHLSQHLFLFEA